jgi:hypothetical protein
VDRSQHETREAEKASRQIAPSVIAKRLRRKGRVRRRGSRQHRARLRPPCFRKLQESETRRVSESRCGKSCSLAEEVHCRHSRCHRRVRRVFGESGRCFSLFTIGKSLEHSENAGSCEASGSSTDLHRKLTLSLRPSRMYVLSRPTEFKAT